VPPARLRAGPFEVEELEAAVSLCASVAFTIQEAAVSLCASVAFTIHNDCLIDFFLAGSNLHDFAGRPRTMRLGKIHELLAGVEPAQGYSLDRLGPHLAERFHEISRAFFILLHWDETYRSLLREADRAGCRSTVLIVNGRREGASRG